jgi:hypothetical protein
MNNHFFFNVPKGCVSISVEGQLITTALCKPSSVVIDLVDKWYETPAKAQNAFNKLIRKIKETPITNN